MRENRLLKAEKATWTVATTRRQNIIKTPAIAANAEASGIIVSGPMYMVCLRFSNGCLVNAAVG